MNAAYIYLQLYRLFDSVTPIKADCGALCNKACCQGEDSGMYLFPGEHKVYELLNNPQFQIQPSEFSYIHNGKRKKVPILFCHGECDRYQRPLACRIFPLTPYLKDGELEIIVDPRAKAICPLSKRMDFEEYDEEFVRNIKKVFKVLMTNKEFYSFMVAYSEYLEDYLRFYK